MKRIIMTGFVLLAVMTVAATGWADGDLEKDFSEPPHEARPWVYFTFMNGYGEPDVFAREIADLKDMGVGGVLHLQNHNISGTPLPHKTQMLSPEWQAWFGQWLRTAKDAGMTLAATILDGHGLGGHWVSAEAGAKQIVFTETQVDGPGTLTEPLRQPLTRKEVYHDVAVLAFREKPTHPMPPSEIRANNVARSGVRDQDFPARHVADGDTETFWQTLTAPTPEQPALLDMTYERPLTAASAYLVNYKGRITRHHPYSEGGIAEAELRASDDGENYRAIKRFSMEPGERRTITFPPVTARHFQLAVFSAHHPGVRLCQFVLLREGDEPVSRPGIRNFAYKSALRGWWTWPRDPYEGLEEVYEAEEAHDLRSADVLDLTANLLPDGTLDWQAPAGRWTILRFGWTAMAEHARQAAAGYETDMLSQRGADLLIDNAAVIMRRLSKENADDEDLVFQSNSWEIGVDGNGQPTWTEEFREQFLRLRGYDLISHLPVLTGRIMDSREHTERFLRDYRDTVADLIAGFYEHLQQRAHAIGSTLNSQAGYGTYTHPHIDGLTVFGRIDRPMGELWYPYGKFGEHHAQLIDAYRTAASAARIYGRRFVQGETLTFHWLLPVITPPSDYRVTLHQSWARGLNQAVLYTFTHQPLEQRPGNVFCDLLNRHTPWWPLADGFMDYMARSQALLQKGLFVADAAYFIGEGASRWVPSKNYLNPALPSGYDYDGINTEVLVTRATVKDGRLVLPDGMSYRYLILSQPQCRTLRASTLGRIRELVEQGLTLIGERPVRTPGLTDLEENEAQLKQDADLLWGTEDVKSGDRRVGQGRVVWGRGPGEVMAADGLPPDVTATVEDKPVEVVWLHRREGDRDIYFLANPSTNQPLHVQVILRAQGKSVELLNPLDGTIRPLPQYVATDDGRTSLPLSFAADQAYFIVVGNTGTDPIPRGVNFPELSPVAAVVGPWQVSFDADWVKPAAVSVGAVQGESLVLEFEQLTDWIDHPEEGIRNYSGLAGYRTSFDFGSSVARGSSLYLSLGSVGDLARVALNGHDLGVVWTPPWRVPIPEGLLKKKDNALVITVANTWRNRLVADHPLPQEERLTLLGTAAQKEMAKHQRTAAGLLGPVQIMSAEAP